MFHELFFGNDEVALQHGVGKESGDADFKSAAGFIGVIDNIAHLHVQHPHTGVHIHHRRHSIAFRVIKHFPARALGEGESLFLLQ